MKAILILAEAAQAAEGRVSTLGSGWSATGTPTPPMALTVFIDCPWDQTNTKHQLKIELVDADGRAVPLGQGPLGQQQTLTLNAEFEVGRPAGVHPGTPIRHCLAINVGPGMMLQPGQKYEYRMTIDDEVMDSWLATFAVAVAPPAFIPPQ